MSKEIIRTLGQIRPDDINEQVLYSVPSGHSAVISSMVVTETGGMAETFDLAIVPDAITHAQGKNRTVSAGKLIDGAAKFLGIVQVADRVQNTNTGLVTTVVSVDSDTQLTIAANIFTTTLNNYIVYPNTPATERRHYIRYSGALAAYTSDEIKIGATLSEFTQIRVGSVNQNAAFSCFGVEITAND